MEKKNNANKPFTEIQNKNTAKGYVIPQIDWIPQVSTKNSRGSSGKKARKKPQRYTPWWMKGYWET